MGKNVISQMGFSNARQTLTPTEIQKTTPEKQKMTYIGSQFLTKFSWTEKYPPYF